MDLTFQVPTQYCSLQHQILLSSPQRSTTEWHFHFGSATSFFLGLLVVILHSSPVAYWTQSSPEGSSFGIISFLLFIQFMGFSQKLYWDGSPFPPPVDHLLSELSTMTCPSWVALHSIGHSFVELHKPLCCDKAGSIKGEDTVKFRDTKSTYQKAPQN